MSSLDFAGPFGSDGALAARGELLSALRSFGLEPTDADLFVELAARVVDRSREREREARERARAERHEARTSCDAGVDAGVIEQWFSGSCWARPGVAQ